MNLRQATVKDAPLLEYWDTKPHVQAGTGEKPFFDDWAFELSRTDARRELLIAETGGRPVGLLHIVDARFNSYWSDFLVSWTASYTDLRALDI